MQLSRPESLTTMISIGTLQPTSGQYTYIFNPTNN